MNKLFLRLSVLCMGLLIVMTSAFADSKPKVVYVFQEHCAMCHKFEETVLSDPAVKKELNKFEFEKIEAHQATMAIDVTPTIIVYDKTGKEIKKFVPSANKNKFMKILKKAQ